MIDKIGFSKYKCFSHEVEIDTPKTVNLIIGKNNSGKSSLLDLAELLYTRKFHEKTNSVEIKLHSKIQEDELSFFSFINLYQPYINVSDSVRNQSVGLPYYIAIKNNNSKFHYSYNTEEIKQIGIYEDFKDYIKESDPNFE